MATWPQLSIDTGKGYTMCFGCGQDNPIGLKLNFQWDGKTARAEFTPNKFHQGWAGFVHGGITTTLLEEAMGYAALFEGANCVAASIQVKLKHLTPIDKPLIITSSIIKKTRKILDAKATVSLKTGTITAEGRATMFIVNTKTK